MRRCYLGKDVAVDIQKLAEGTVIFEDVGVECRRGRIIATLKSARGRKTSDPLSGRIVYETVKGSIEIPYGDKDQRGDYTLQTGDLVDFNIATDRRDRLQRATNIQLVDDTFKISGEKREMVGQSCWRVLGLILELIGISALVS